MEITFRPHHFLCAYCFKGKGYSPDFIANFSEIMKELNAPGGDAIVIEAVPHTDSICSPCPHKRDLTCTSQEKILKLDSAHAKVLNIFPSEKITWGEVKKRIREDLTLDQFNIICAPCEWKKLGICEDTLTNRY